MNVKLQKDHYEAVASHYANHYDGKDSRLYRQQFIESKLFAKMDLRGKLVLDAMCGSGSTSNRLVELGAIVTGVDVSLSIMKQIEQNLQVKNSVVGNVCELPFKSQSFDYITVVGGLHHLHPHLAEGMKEFIRVLKTNGRLLVFEPPSNSIFDMIRTIWYRYDDLFEKNEASIDVKRLVRDWNIELEFDQIEYGGGPGYIFIFNSMIIRLPLSLKRFIVKPLIYFEKLIDGRLPSWLAMYVVISMRKR